jgi:hypothetical protein
MNRHLNFKSYFNKHQYKYYMVHLPLLITPLISSNISCVLFKKNLFFPLELYNFKLFINNDNFIICFTVLNLKNVWQASSLFNLMTSTVFKCCQTYYFIALIPTKLKTLKCCLSNIALSTCTHNCIVQAFLRRGGGGGGGVHYFWRIISVFMVYQFMYWLVLYYKQYFFI